MALSPADRQYLLSSLQKRHAQVRRDEVAVVRAVEAALLRARTKWPRVELSDRAFLELLVGKLDGADGVLAGLTALRTSDLYAACAAGHGDAAAVECILETSRADLQKTLRSMKLDEVEFDEVLQRLRERLFVASPGRAPRVLSFAGTGSLAAWLAAAATRLAIDLKRANSDVVEEFDERVAATLTHAVDPELTYLRERYRKDFREAFQEVFSSLERDDRNLLRLTFLDGLSIDELSPLLGLHRSSVARRVARLRERLGAETRSRLRDRLQLTAAELASLMRLVRSAFDVSLARVLAEPEVAAQLSRPRRGSVAGSRRGGRRGG